MAILSCASALEVRVSVSRAEPLRIARELEGRQRHVGGRLLGGPRDALVESKQPELAEVELAAVGEGPADLFAEEDACLLLAEIGVVDGHVLALPG